MIANISPAQANCAETVSTLRFAREAKRVKNQAVVNEDAVGTNLMLKAELQRVKVQLAAMHGQAPALDTALATSLAFDEQPNNAAAQAAQSAQQALVSALRREGTAAKQVYHLQSELAALQDLLTANQRELQRNQMVMKFRTAEVERRRAQEAPDVEVELQSLREEVKSLHRELSSLAQGTDHPEVKRFAFENERLSWELEQVQGLVDQQELAQMRSDLDSLRSQMLLMAEREDNMQAVTMGQGSQARQPFQELPSQRQDPAQALEIMELRDQLQDAQDAISEAHSNSAGLKEHNRQLEEQISRMEQQLADAVRELRASKMALSPMARQMAGVKEGQEAVQDAQLEATACKESLQALQHSYASSLESTEAQRQECSRLGQVVGELEGQLGLMEHKCRSLNQDKEQLEDELHAKQALLHGAATDAQHAQTEAAQAAHNSNARHEQAVARLQSQLDVHQMTAQDIQSQLILKDQLLAQARQELANVEAHAERQQQELVWVQQALEEQEHHMAQLRSSVVGQVNEAEAEVEEARTQAEQERQERRAQMHTLLAEKAELEAALQQQHQAARQLQDAAAKAQLQHQQAVDKHTSDAATCNAHVQHLSNEVQQQQVQIVSLQEHVQAAQQQRDAAQRQLESLQAQHAQQAPQVAELLTERKAWIQDLQKERAAASAAASAAEAMQQRLWQAEAAGKEAGVQLEAVQGREALLEQQVTALTGQHNIHQRIQHHQKVKDENNALRGQLAACRDDLAKQSIRLERALEELGGYRKAVGRSTTPDFNEEDRLRADLHTSEAQKRQLGQDSQALANLVLELAHKQACSDQDAIHQDDRSSLNAVQLVKTAVQTMNGVSLDLSNMKRSIDDKEQQIKMLQELNKILQLQASMQS